MRLRRARARRQQSLLRFWCTYGDSSLQGVPPGAIKQIPNTLSGLPARCRTREFAACAIAAEQAPGPLWSKREVAALVELVRFCTKNGLWVRNLQTELQTNH